MGEALNTKDLASKLSDEEFLYGYIAEFQDGNLPPELEDRFKALLEKKEATLGEAYVEARGHFQIAFQKWSLDEPKLHKLRSLVESDVERADHEAGNIKELGQTELRGNILRASVLLSLIAIIAGVFYYVLGPTGKPKFKALENLVYEAIVLEEDADRLDLPTKNFAEVADYIQRYPKLGFSPFQVAPLGEPWQVEGATVIDYEFAKIPVVAFLHTELRDKLYLFQYEGELSDLARAEQGEYGPLKYQTYSDDRVNIIAWQAKEGVMGMMISRRGAAEMATLASKAMVK